MSSARATSLGLALLAAASMAGCNDLYTERRDRIALSAGDALAANKLTHMVDPWPRASADRNIAFNGEKMQSAVERYRRNRVTPPVGAMTSSAQYQQGLPAAAPAPATSGKP